MSQDAKSDRAILVVDDQPTNIRVLFDCLSQAGYATLAARNGKDAIASAKRAQPGLILLDVMMPGIDGFETCRRLKEDPETSEIPVIFMTALTEVSEKVKAFEAGAVDYVSKPFQHDEVVARIAAHLTLQRQKRELAEAAAIKDKFFSIIAHDMRSLFMSMIYLPESTVVSLENDDLENARDYAQRTHAAAKRASRLFENLLDWSRLQIGQMDFQPEPLDCAAVADGVLELFKANAERKSITLHSAISSDLRARADRNMLDAILRNLISNALKFTRPDGTVSLSAKRLDGLIQISVRDSGVGMTESQIKNVFRVEEKTVEKGTEGERGSGLGLILCKELIERHGGAIHTESQPDKGTCFRFSLPEAPTEAGA
jgi:two-component system, sensor histidine kinase and response regulator